jgi:hypothetical protein
MIVEDPIIVRWLGEAGHLLHRPLPLVVGAVVTALGWWMSRGTRHHVPERL